jgi:tol-pal system protein YbgF
MLLRRLAATGLIAVLLASAAPVLAQTQLPPEGADPLDARDAKRVERMEKVVRELRAIVFQGRDTGKPVVVQPAETDFQIQELTRRVADLEQALTRVNGALETSNHDLDQTRRQAQALAEQNKALTDRLTVLEQGGQGPAPVDAGGQPLPPSAAFDRARQMMQTGDYDGAEVAFEDFVGRYGDSTKAPEARYWLGKTLTARGAHAEAATAYIGAVRGWPKSSWAPDAVVELSRSLVALKKTPDACATLAELDRRYPKAPEAVQTRAAATRKQAKCSA